MALACGVASSSARADELPITSISPPNGARIPPSPSGVSFHVESPIVFNGNACLGIARLAVSTQNVLDQVAGNGALAFDFVVEYPSMTSSQAVPGLDYATTARPLPIGVYYWQVTGSCFLTFVNYVSPVYTFTVDYAPTPPPVAPATPHPLSIEEAYLSVKSIITETTGRSAHRLRDHCASRNIYTVACKASWASSQRLSSSTLLYSGNFFLEQQLDGFHTSFVGRRSRHRCIRGKRCTSSVHWHHIY